MMLSMHTNALQNSILQTSTSRLVSNFSEVGKLEWQVYPVLLFLKMFILKLTKPLVLLDLLDHNGVTQVHNNLPPDPLQAHQTTIGEADLLRSTPHPIFLQILMTSETKLVVLVLSLVLYNLNAPPVPGKQSK
jgi:hypothetical protein